MRSNPAFAELLRRQRGSISVRQAATLGVRRNALHRLVAKGWSRPHPGVYSAPDSEGFSARLWAAVLWAGPGAVVSHRSAGFLLGLDGVPPVVEITIPLSAARSAPSVIVHRSEVPQEDWRTREGLPVTRAARTLIDLAGCLEPLDLGIAVESAWRKRLAELGWIERRLRELETRGRRGTSELDRILADCRRRGRPLDSALEVKLWRLLLESTLPRPIPQYELRDLEGQPMRLDFAFPDKRLAIEADGHEVHSALPIFERDRVRLSRIAALGWRVVHVTWRQLQEPGVVLARIERALSRRAWTEDLD